MYIVMNVLEVPDEAKARMSGMFAQAAENMKNVPGCLEFLFLEATDGAKQVVYTKWKDEASFEAWHTSDSFAQAHARERVSGSPATGSHVETFTVVHHS